MTHRISLEPFPITLSHPRVSLLKGDFRPAMVQQVLQISANVAASRDNPSAIWRSRLFSTPHSLQWGHDTSVIIYNNTF